MVAHSCSIFLCHLNMEIQISVSDHLVGRLTIIIFTLVVVKPTSPFSAMVEWTCRPSPPWWGCLTLAGSRSSTTRSWLRWHGKGVHIFWIFDVLEAHLIKTSISFLILWEIHICLRIQTLHNVVVMFEIMLDQNAIKKGSVSSENFVIVGKEKKCYMKSQ